jgi:anaerobic selenocysteine-containing dehydrogenase
LADQWIPIKPGTDHAMFLAMAYVLFKEDLWDKDFVARYVEHNGFEGWKNYVLGKEDGIEKTPQWAEIQCAVPAQTIHELARTVASVKPAWLTCHWGTNDKNICRLAGDVGLLGNPWGWPLSPSGSPTAHSVAGPLGPEGGVQSAKDVPQSLLGTGSFTS